MNEITKQKIWVLLDSMKKTFEILYGRWQDEKEYEDWKDYQEHFKKTFNAMKELAKAKNAVFVKATKRPFGITFDFEGWTVVFYIKTTEYGWKAKKI